MSGKLENTENSALADWLHSVFFNSWPATDKGFILSSFANSANFFIKNQSFLFFFDTTYTNNH
jgi:hypothetical protein